MPELRRNDVDTSAFVPTKIDTSKIRFKDKHRERQRQANLKIGSEGKKKPKRNRPKQVGWLGPTTNVFLTCRP